MKAKKKSSPRKSKSAKRPVVAKRTTVGRISTARRLKSARASSAGKRTVGKRVALGKKPASRRRRMQIPAILFEGDRPAPPPLSGPGEKFALGEHSEAKAVETAELPETYGTGRIFVTNRDPHWLYVHWDFTREQQRYFNANSVHGHLILRTYVETLTSAPVSEIHVHPESRHWFVHVERASTQYLAELGFYGRNDQWHRVATSAPTHTAPDAISTDATMEFATIPWERPFAELLDEIRNGGEETLPLAKGLEELRQRRRQENPSATMSEVPVWTPERERAVAEAIRMDSSPCAWMDSLAIYELIQGPSPVGEEMASLGAADLGLAVWPSGSEETLSSPTGGFNAEAKGFWFNVNAELVIYGATERDAMVTIDGRMISLRPDGTFSFRFALPDGQYDLNMAAMSPDGTDGRSVHLRFTRATDFAGEVGMHPQDPALKPPAGENV